MLLDSFVNLSSKMTKTDGFSVLAQVSQDLQYLRNQFVATNFSVDIFDSIESQNLDLYGAQFKFLMFLVWALCWHFPTSKLQSHLKEPI